MRATTRTSIVQTGPVGRHLAARYDLEELISTGGMGAVWRATDETLHRVVAVKLLELDEGVIPDAAERFLREAQIAASLIHPNIVSVFDYGVDGSTARFGRRSPRLKGLGGSALPDAEPKSP